MFLECISGDGRNIFEIFRNIPEIYSKYSGWEKYIPEYISGR